MNRKPHGYWNNRENRRQFLDDLGRKRGNRSYEDWYTITQSEIVKNGGASILNKYNNATSTFIMDCFPEYEWLPWKFTKAPNGFWQDLHNVRRYLDWLAERLSITDMEGWYGVNCVDFKQNHGTGLLLGSFNGSVQQILKAAYPDFPWLPWKFWSVPNNFWEDVANVRCYISWLGNELGIISLEQWYNIGAEAYRQGLISHKFNGSPLQILSAVYPEFDWLPWRFTNAPNGFWSDDANIIRYIKWLENAKGITSPDQWYDLFSEELLNNNYGGGLVTRFGRTNRLQQDILRLVYPEYKWLPWMFLSTPDGYWDEHDNCLLYMKWFGEKIGVEMPSYLVTAKDFHNLYGGSLLQKFHGIRNLFHSLYPDYGWPVELNHLLSIKNRRQLRMHKIVQKIFPDAIHEHRHKDKKFVTNYQMTSDTFIPSINIYIEYRGRQHSEPVSCFGGKDNFNKTKVRDDQKRNKLDTIEIWDHEWDGTEEYIVTLLSRLLITERNDR